jgi:LacI family transcriptional regulator
MGKVTIKDIAAILKTSPKTVSKALNNQPGVSQQLREQIQQKAHELRYVPNMFGRGLSGKASQTIGVIITDNTNPMYALILGALEQKAAAAQYTIMLCNSHNDLRIEQQIVRLLVERRVDGVIIRPVDTPETSKNLEILRQFDIPYIIVNRLITRQKQRCFRPDNFLAAYRAGQYLIAKGHTRILHLTRQDRVSEADERIGGLHKAFEDNRLTLAADRICRRCAVSVESAYTETLKILQERRDFTAIFAYNDMMAFGVMKAVHECRLRIPSDVAIMGMDNVMFADLCLVPLTTVDHHLGAVGARAMEVLLNTIQQKPEPLQAIPDPYIVERSSV